MLHKAALCSISSGSALFAKIKQSTRTEIHHFIDILTGNPLKYKIDNSILSVSICMDGKG